MSWRDSLGRRRGDDEELDAPYYSNEVSERGRITVKPLRPEPEKPVRKPKRKRSKGKS